MPSAIKEKTMQLRDFILPYGLVLAAIGFLAYADGLGVRAVVW